MRAIHASLSRRTTLALVSLGVTLGVAAVACAGNEDERAPLDVDAGSSMIPVGDAMNALDAADGECSDASADCGAPEPSCDADWCPVFTILDERIGLSAVWGSGPNDVWVVGAAGTVLHWDGSAWATVSVGTTQSLYAVWGSGPNDVWAVSTPGAIFHTTGFANGSAEWSRATEIADAGVDTASAGKLSRAIWGTSPRDVWVGGDPFARKGSSATWGGFRTVFADADADAGDGVTDGGIVWTPVSSSLVTAIWGSGPEDIWVVGPGSKGLASGGSSAAHSNGAVGADGVPVWTAFDTQSTDVLYAIWGSGPGDVWAVGDHGTIRHFTAGATRWSIIDSPTTAKLRGVWGSGPSDVWAVGDDGTLIHYDGTKWSSATADFAPGEKPSLFGVWGSSPNDVFAVGSGTVFHYSGPKPVTQGAGR